MNPASFAGGRRRNSRAKVEGKNPERLRPSNAQVMESGVAEWQRETTRTSRAEDSIAMRCSELSRIYRSSSEENRRPTVRADHRTTMADCPPRMWPWV